MENRERDVLYYSTRNGVTPFRVWRSSIADSSLKAAVDARIARFRGGNFGDSKPIGGGASENRIDLGPGYRIYYGVRRQEVVLLCGGDKSTQREDIGRAKEYWSDYKERTKPQKDRKASRTDVQGRPHRRAKR